MNSIFGKVNISENALSTELFNNGIDKPTTFSKTNNTLCIVSDCAIYNKEEIYRELQISDKSLSDEVVILKSYEVWGKDCVKHLIGDFSFAIWDKEKNELFCARDHLGVKPFNYYFDNKNFIFSSDISSITEQSDLNLSINEQYIADSISIIKSEHSISTYNEIKKLPPAHYLTIKNNKLNIEQYWKLEPKEITTKDDDEIIEGFKSILIESVKCRILDKENIGTELSGGIDSSSITAIASKHCKLKTFSHVLPDTLLGKIHPFKDERDFMNLLGDFCEISDRNFITSEESLVKVIRDNIGSSKDIFQQNFGMFSDQLYRSAMQLNVSILLSGFGGDEVVTSKSLTYLSELALKGDWNEIKDDLKNQDLNKKSQIKSIIKYYIKSKFPFTQKIYSILKSEKPWWIGKFENLAFNTVFAERLNIKERYYSNYNKPANLSLQERNIERITHPHVAQRLEYCTLIAQKYGLEYRYPLLDIRLIEYYLGIPARLKARNGIGRYAIRKAIEGIVPKGIQWRNDKSGATIPTVFMRTLSDKEKILEIINRAKSNDKIKKYIDLEKYEQWFQKICNRSDGKQKNINPGAFYNYLKLILFIEQNPNLFK